MITLAEKLLLLLASGTKSKPYVEFISSTPMTITPKYTNSGVTLQYSLNGTSWTNITSGATTPSANVIYFRGQATGTKALFASGGTSNSWVFIGATNLECNGKFDRLLQNSLGDNKDILSVGSFCFSHMFYTTSALVYVDKDCLPATGLAGGCYHSMFYGCTSLTTAPSLPATALAAYCHRDMFYGCTSLTTAPSLPATILAPYCYQNMFYGCTSLTIAPSLPATTLVDSCYQNMFYGCTKIKLSTTQTGIYDTPYRIPTTGTGTTATDALANMFANTGGTFTGTPSIDTTYYTENTPV